MIQRTRNGLRYRVGGNWSDPAQPAIIFIHGMGGSLHNFAGLFSKMARDFPVLTVELPGHGRSDDTVGVWSLASVSASVGQAIQEAIGQRPRVLVGHSLGSFIAAELATLEPKLTLNIVAISGDLFHVAELLRTPFASVFRDPLRMLAVAGALFTATSRPSAALCARLNTSTCLHILLWPFLSPSLTRKQEMVGDSFKEQGGSGALRMLRLAEHVRLEPLYRACPCPIVFVVGANDPLSTDTDRRHVREWFGEHALVSVPGSGHWPQVEDVDRVATAITELCPRSR